MTELRKHFTVAEANTFFILLAVLFLTVGGYVQSRELISGFLITEYGIMLLPVLLYTIIKKKEVVSIFRLKRLPLNAIMKIMGLAALLLPIIAVANLLTIFIIELFGTSIVSPIPTATSFTEFILLFFVIAVSAGICEEFFFRGPILSAYESEVGRKWGAIFSGLLFGIFHFNPQNLLGPIILGVVFSYLVQVTGSIFAGVVAHITNNGIAVTMGYLTSNVGQSELSALQENQLIFDSPGVILGVMGFYLIVGLVCFSGIKRLLKSINRQFVDEPIWDQSPLNLEYKHYLPIGLSVVIYFLIIYLAYFS
ncbi:MAG: CPBP family intramembrane metalloprotease [Firmicutes bacterium]|nr:CPBP family intramembrane metalloprotease [Bacillota bacterium]